MSTRAREPPPGVPSGHPLLLPKPLPVDVHSPKSLEALLHQIFID